MNKIVAAKLLSLKIERARMALLMSDASKVYDSLQPNQKDPAQKMVNLILAYQKDIEREILQMSEILIDSLTDQDLQ